MKQSTFALTRFENQSGLLSWRVEGRLHGIRIRKNFQIREEAAAEKAALELKSMQAASGLRLTTTFLTDAQLREFSYNYDLAGELVSVATWDGYNYAVHSSGTHVFPNVSYAYDGDGRVIAENQGGTYGNETDQPGDAIDPAAYGSLPGNLTGGRTNTFTYDAAGNRLSALYGAGVAGNRTLNSAYDALNRVANITDVTSGNLVTTYHYDLGGRKVGLLYPSGSNITTAYDPLGRQAEITGTGNATTTRYDFVLSYDKYNNLGKQAETYANGNLASRNVTLVYDGADRLTSEVLARSGGATITSNYTYDDAYNRTSKITSNTSNSTVVGNVTYHFNNGNQLAWFSDPVANVTSNYTYDGAGNRRTKAFHGHDVTGNYNYTNTSNYTFDSENHLIEANLSVVSTGSSNHTTQVYQADDYLYGYDYRTRRTFMDDDGQLGSNTTTDGSWQELFDGGTPRWRLIF